MTLGCVKLTAKANYDIAHQHMRTYLLLSSYNLVPNYSPSIEQPQLFPNFYDINFFRYHIWMRFCDYSISVPTLSQCSTKVYLSIQIAVITGLHSFYVITVLLFGRYTTLFLSTHRWWTLKFFPLFNFCEYCSKMGAYGCHFGIQFSFKYMPHNITAPLYKISIYGILGALDTVFHSSCTNLRCHQQCTWSLFLYNFAQTYHLPFLVTTRLTMVKS